jgi:hypothetical protein
VSHDCFLVANMGAIGIETIDRFLEAVSDIADLPAR